MCETNADCPICTLEVEASTRHTLLECSHTYHLSCIRKWILRSATCPMCRRGVSGEQMFQIPWRDNVRVSTRMFAQAAALTTTLSNEMLWLTLRYGWKTALVHEGLLFTQALIMSFLPDTTKPDSAAKFLVKRVLLDIGRQFATGFLLGGSLWDASWFQLAINASVIAAVGQLCASVFHYYDETSDEQCQRRQEWVVCTPRWKRGALFAVGALAPIVVLCAAQRLMKC